MAEINRSHEIRSRHFAYRAVEDNFALMQYNHPAADLLYEVKVMLN
jgi:hypothetical protein